VREVCSGLSQTKASLIEFSSACSEEGKKDENKMRRKWEESNSIKIMEVTREEGESKMQKIRRLRHENKNIIK
jgi:hypothetical protein